MQLSYRFASNLLLYIALVMTLFSVVRCNCPSQKVCRKNQKSRLETLTITDVVVESLYQGTTRGYHKFLVEQVWSQNKGNLRPGENFYVDTTSGAPYWECFRKLYLDDSYFLMLTPSDETSHVFRPLEPPAFSDHKKLRQAIFTSLCAPPGKSSDSCDMIVTLPKRMVYYQDQKQSIVCKVDSLDAVTEVEWYKDGTELFSDASVGITLKTNEKDYSVLAFSRISALHVGTYKCVATNDAGLNAFAETRIDVAGPLSLSHFQECDEASFCFNDGHCRQSFDGRKSCECPKDFYGSRCEKVVIQHTEDCALLKSTDTEEMKVTVSHLTTALTAVSITLFFVLLLSLSYVMRVKKRQETDKKIYDEPEKGMSLQEIPADGYNTPSNVESLLLEEVITPVRIFVEDSQQSIEIVPSPVPSRKSRSTSDQYLSVRHQNMTPRTPMRSLKSCGNKSSLSTPVSPCPSPGSPYNLTKRERLNGRSFS